jgi:hypothetical protein
MGLPAAANGGDPAVAYGVTGTFEKIYFAIYLAFVSKLLQA